MMKIHLVSITITIRLLADKCSHILRSEFAIGMIISSLFNINIDPAEVFSPEPGPQQDRVVRLHHL